MAHINQEIRKHIVQLQFNGHKTDIRNGSGVIIKPFDGSNIVYIFTAKHTFFEEDIENGTPTLYHNNIRQYTKGTTSLKQKFSIDKVIELNNIEGDIDLLILELNISDNKFFKDIEPLSIYNDEIEQCIVSGFPKVNDYKDLAYIPSRFINSDKSYYFEFDPQKTLSTYEDGEIDVIGGISGGGVFVEGNDGTLYLAGIETGLYGVNNLEAINLIKIIEKINEQLNTSLQLGGFKALDDFDLAGKILETKFLGENLSNEYIDKVKDESNILEILNDDSREEYKELETQLKTTKESMKKLALAYLYRGIKFNGHNNHKATANFKKAVLLNPKEVENYFALAKYERSTNKKKEVHLDNDKTKKLLIEIDSIKSKINNSTDYEILENLYLNLLYNLEKYDSNDYEIIKYKKELINLYIDNSDLFQAERELLKNISKLDKVYISKQLSIIYFNEKYINQLNDEEVAKKLFSLLPLMDNEVEKDEVRYKIDKLNLYNKNMLDLNEKFFMMEQQIKNYQTKIVTLTGMLSNDARNKEVLEQVNLVNEKIDKSDKTLTNISEYLKNKSNKYFILFLKEIHQSNKILVNKIQTIYNQNNRVNDKVEMMLNSSIKNMSSQLNSVMKEPKKNENQYIMDIEKIIKSCNTTFYKKIKKLYRRDENSSKEDLLKKAISLAEQRHQEHLVSLKILLIDKDNENFKLNILYKEETIKLERAIDSLALDYQKSEKKSSLKETELIELKDKYNRFKESVNGNILSETEKLIYKDELEELKKIIERLKGKNEQIDDLQESIFLSSKIANILVDLEKDYRDKIDEVEKRFYKIKDNPKNKKRFRKIYKQVKKFENTLKEIKESTSTTSDLESILDLLKIELEKIESTIYWSTLDAYYNKSRFIVLGVIFLVPITVYLVDTPLECISWIKSIWHSFF